MMVQFRAFTGQTPPRIIAKAAVSLLFIAVAALFSREGPALAFILIFMGITGPAIRLVTMKMGGIFDRLIVSPVSKPVFFLGFAGIWCIAVLLPLIPAIVVVAVMNGPVTILPVILGTVLAVMLGTLAGFVSRGLSEAHLAALLASALLLVLSLVRTPLAFFMPYAALSSGTCGLSAFAAIMVLPIVALVVLVLVVSRF